MDSKPEPVYEEFEVHTDWVHGVADDTLIAHIPGFTKQHIKVQVTRRDKLRISGERPIDGNKFSRFYKEIPIPSNCDPNKIRANFSGGMLHVKHPKLIVPAGEKQEQAKPSGESDQKPAPRHADVPQKQNNAVGKAPPKATMEKQAGDEKTDGIAKEADNVSWKAPDKEKERKYITNIAANESNKPMEKERKGWDQEEKTSTSDKRGKLGDSVQDAAEKENVELKKLDGTDKYQIAIIMAWLKYKQVLDDLAKELKNPRKMMKMVLAVLLVTVLAVYLRKAIRSLRSY